MIGSAGIWAIAPNQASRSSANRDLERPSPALVHVRFEMKEAANWDGLQQGRRSRQHQAGTLSGLWKIVSPQFMQRYCFSRSGPLKTNLSPGCAGSSGPFVICASQASHNLIISASTWWIRPNGWLWKGASTIRRDDLDQKTALPEPP